MPTGRDLPPVFGGAFIDGQDLRLADHLSLLFGQVALGARQFAQGGDRLCQGPGFVPLLDADQGVAITEAKPDLADKLAQFGDFQADLPHFQVDEPGAQPFLLFRMLQP